MEECNENIEETSFINSANCKSNSCILYIVSFSILFTINIGIATYFIYYKYLNHNEKKNGGNKTNKILKIDYYYFYNIIDLKDFDARLLKIDKKSYKDIGIYNIGYITKKKIDDCKNINSVNPLYLNITHVNGYIEEKGVNKYLVFDSMELHSKEKIRELLKKCNDIFNGIRDKIK